MSDRVNYNLTTFDDHRSIPLPNGRRNGIHMHDTRALHNLTVHMHSTIRNRSGDGGVDQHGVTLFACAPAQENVRVLQTATRQQRSHAQARMNNITNPREKHILAGRHLVRKLVDSKHVVMIHCGLVDKTGKVSVAR
jgi:hypothetical protein